MKFPWKWIFLALKENIQITTKHFCTSRLFLVDILGGISPDKHGVIGRQSHHVETPTPCFGDMCSCLDATDDKFSLVTTSVMAQDFRLDWNKDVLKEEVYQYLQRLKGSPQRNYLICNSIGWWNGLDNVIESMRNGHILNNIALMDNMCQMSRKG